MTRVWTLTQLALACVAFADGPPRSCCTGSWCPRRAAAPSWLVRSSARAPLTTTWGCSRAAPDGPTTQRRTWSGPSLCTPAWVPRRCWPVPGRRWRRSPPGPLPRPPIVRASTGRGAVDRAVRRAGEHVARRRGPALPRDPGRGARAGSGRARPGPDARRRSPRQARPGRVGGGSRRSGRRGAGRAGPRRLPRRGWPSWPPSSTRPSSGTTPHGPLGCAPSVTSWLTSSGRHSARAAGREHWPPTRSARGSASPAPCGPRSSGSAAWTPPRARTWPRHAHRRALLLPPRAHRIAGIRCGRAGSGDRRGGLHRLARRRPARGRRPRARRARRVDPAGPRRREATVGRGSCWHADVRDPDALRAALRGVDAVCHQAAMVGHGVDARDAPATPPTTTSAPPCCSPPCTRRVSPAGAGRVDGRLRRGPLHLRRARRRPAGPARAADIAAGRFEPPCPVCGRDLEPGLVPEDAPLDPRSTYAATKLAQEHLAERVGAPDRGSGVVAALPQRVRPPDAARHPLLRGGVGVPVARWNAASRRG